MDTDRPAVTELTADVATAVARQVVAVCADVFEAILREMPELRDDKSALAVLDSSVHGNVDTCLQILLHRIDVADVHVPTAAAEYARRLAQRGTPLAALLRTYRLGHARFSDWLLGELARQTDNAELISATALNMSRIVARYIDLTSESMVAAYDQESLNWARKRSAARAARIRDLVAGERVNASEASATLGYRLDQNHVGLVCWVDTAAGTADEITRLERAVGRVARQAGCPGEPLFLPRDESSAWAWLPLGVRDAFDPAAASGARADPGLCVAFGNAANGVAGFRLTHQQAIAAETVALAAGAAAPRVVAFGEVAPVAMMLRSEELLRAWVLGVLADLATDDADHARLRETLLVFLQSGGSYKTTAERLTLHRNTVHYRIRKAEEGLGRPVGEKRQDVELALRTSRWLGSYVLQPPAAGGSHDDSRAS